MTVHPKDLAKQLVELSDEEWEQLQLARQIKKAREPVQLPSLIPAAPKYQTLPKIFSEKEIHHLFATILHEPSLYPATLYGAFIRSRDLMLVKMQYYLALRPSEVRQVIMDDFIRADDGTISMVVRPETNKSRLSRVIYVPKDLLAELTRYLQKFKGGFSGCLFPNTRGEPLSGDRHREIFKHLLEAANLYKKPQKHTHGGTDLYMLRHSRATHLLDQGNSVFDVQQLLGHKSLEITAVYLHLTKAFHTRQQSLLEKKD